MYTCCGAVRVLPSECFDLRFRCLFCKCIDVVVCSVYYRVKQMLNIYNATLFTKLLSSTSANVTTFDAARKMKSHQILGDSSSGDHELFYSIPYLFQHFPLDQHAGLTD